MKHLRQWMVALSLAWAAVSVAHAHLVVSQHGTLNIVGDGAYLVLSLPVSALAEIDDNRDGLLSTDELRSHSARIEAQIKQGITLNSAQRQSRLEGVMLNIEASDHDPMAPSTHLVVLGRFAIDPQAPGLTLSLRLFGTRPDERAEQIAVTRGSESQLITLTPEHPQGSVLPSTWAAFTEQVRLGTLHVVSGPDHLLFLLVVLTAAWSLRQVVLALTCFTAGHAVTLVACGWYGLSVPSGLVEPAIAATIVVMALFDRWSAQRTLPKLVAIRLALVFACALIHGLGLAGALGDLGLNGMGKVWSLAGFNTGIELGQIAVALTATLVLRGVRRVGGPIGLAKTTRSAAYASMALGSFWFIQRTLG
jgi:hypothetical protein